MGGAHRFAFAGGHWPAEDFGGDRPQQLGLAGGASEPVVRVSSTSGEIAGSKMFRQAPPPPILKVIGSRPKNRDRAAYSPSSGLESEGFLSTTMTLRF
ncbi:hypothetical protein, partial [Glutamicibacter arilaitensis]|uniref:hypothetical protein n=1 Tax=Glutamicibacter arilaitensis TaxID=256701 RepID=UPI003FCF0B2E